ncbi:MAG: hypothetical protein K2M70_03420, partial [Lachnospiraceae bacterium]|nr:hypothetical protein [Lachnospiraceae bacterium]
EVNSNYKDYKNDYLERLQEGKDEEKEDVKEQGTGNKSESIPVPKDEYISSEQSGRKPSGLYHMGKDENGNPKVMYDDPKKAGSGEDDAEEVTGNTDAVDREIEKLKKQKQQLEQQIRKASGDEEKTKELEKKLAQVESELSQKDNDTYRRQHTVITSRA